MNKKISETIEKLRLDQNEINNLIIILAEKFSSVTNTELRLFGINKKVFLMIRSLIIEIHLLLEFYLNEYIAWYFIKDKSDSIQCMFTRNSFKDLFLINNRNITFSEKVKILKKISRTRLKNFIPKIEKINDIRNAFVHGYPIQDKKFNYNNGKHILGKNNIFNLWQDALQILSIFREEIGQADNSSVLFNTMLGQI